jgi:hypothetical protein
VARARPGRFHIPRMGGGFGAHPGHNPFDINLGPLQVGGHTPDYQSLIKSDPGYMAFEASKNQAFANAATKRGQSIKNLTLQFGGLPAGFKDAYGDLGAADIAAGQNNPFSTEHQIQQGYDQSVLDTKRQMAARGVLQSGDTVYGLQQDDQARAKAEYEATQALLQALQGAIGDYTGTVSDYGNQEYGAISDASGRIENLYPTTPGHGAGYDTALSQHYGEPIYRDADGKLWGVGPHGPEPFDPAQAPRGGGAGGAGGQAAGSSVPYVHNPFASPPRRAKRKKTRIRP